MRKKNVENFSYTQNIYVLKIHLNLFEISNRVLKFNSIGFSRDRSFGHETTSWTILWTISDTIS